MSNITIKNYNAVIDQGWMETAGEYMREDGSINEIGLMAKCNLFLAQAMSDANIEELTKDEYVDLVKQCNEKRDKWMGNSPSKSDSGSESKKDS